MQNHKMPKQAWAELATRANLMLQEKEMTPNSLAELAEIDYHAARRMLLNGVGSQTKNATVVCIMLGLIVKNEKVQNLSMADIQQAISECWNGDSSHAELLIRLIRSTANFKIAFTAKD